MADHTPGPWHIETRQHVHAICCQPARKGEHPEIVFVENHGSETQGSITALMRTNAELLANAQLIAAAPDLLAALKSFLRAPSIGSNGPGSLTIVVQEFNLQAARAAIARAEGA